MSIRVGFTGTSSEVPPDQLRALLRVWEQLHDAIELHHGDCIGADAQAHVLWMQKGDRRVVIHPPENPLKRAWCTGGVQLPPAPYLARNRAIVEATDVLCACPHEREGEALRSGVWATVRHARKLRRPVAILRPHGHIDRERWPLDGPLRVDRDEVMLTPGGQSTLWVLLGWLGYDSHEETEPQTNLERETGFEPATPSLGSLCSTN